MQETFNEKNFNQIHFGKNTAFQQPYILPLGETHVVSSTARDLGDTFENKIS